MTPARRATVFGNTSLSRFDVLVIGSGAAGSAAAEVLARNGRKVLVLEAGSNYFEGLDDPDPAALSTLYSNDEIKLMQRYFIQPDPLVEPRSYRPSAEDGERVYVGDVNHLPKTVGGGGVHAHLATFRFAPFDFELGTRLGASVPGADFADWPLSYDEIDPFYAHAERVLGVQGDAAGNPYEPPRSGPYPMPPGVPLAIDGLVREAASSLGHHPYPTPHAITSRPYDGRPACAGCGFCGFYGCPIHAKGSPAVTSLRRALLCGNAQLRCETRAVKLELRGGTEIAGVEALDPEGRRVSFSADRYVLATGPIEDARLLALSGGGTPIGNRSGLVGRNLMFHLMTSVSGIFARRLHPQRGKAATMGFCDFRGEPGDPERPLGGVVLAATSPGPVSEGLGYKSLFGVGPRLRSFLGQSWLRDRTFALSMFGEDAPQPTNRVDLDPGIRDLDGLPVARITYRSHAFELAAREHYLPKLLAVMRAAGSKYELTPPIGYPIGTRHVMGTLRFGTDPARSVCDRRGRFHDVGNLYGSGGSLFPTSSGYNPILTISALGSWVGANLVDPDSPARALT